MSKGEVTRQRIIELAAPLFNQRGFAGCSLQDIMAATGLEKGGIYRHFQSKEELAVESFKYARSVAFASRAVNLQPGATELDRLRKMIAAFISKPNPIKGGCPLLNTAVDADDGNAELKALSKQAFVDWRRRIRLILARAIAKGEISAGTDARQMANVIVASLEGALVLSRVDGNRRPLDHVQASLNAILNSIETKKQK
jgi:TetR/AcrR family transcriptional repressor of nem operon